MKPIKSDLVLAAGAALLSIMTVSGQRAEAGRFFARGQNGAAGGYATQGQC